MKKAVKRLFRRLTSWATSARDEDRLRAEIDERSDVERVAGENDDIEFRSCRQQPVELRQ